LETRQKIFKDKEHELKVVIESLATQMKDLEERVEGIMVEQERRSKWILTADKEGQEAMLLKRQMETCESSIEDLRSELGKLEAEEATHNQNIVNINLRIPSLQAEKNVAVRTKNFKQAANVSKEIKDLSASKQESETAIVSLKESIAVTTATLEKEKKNHELLESKIEEFEGKVDENRLLNLIVIQKDLEKVLSTLENQSDEKFFPSTAEKLSVEAQLHGCLREQQQLRQKHSWSSDFPHQSSSSQSSSSQQSQSQSQSQSSPKQQPQQQQQQQQIPEEEDLYES